MASRYKELYNDANSAYNNGRYQESALLLEQAQRLAQQQGTPAQAFKCGVWAAFSWELAGHPLRTLTLLADLLKAIPPSADPMDVWRAKKHVFEISRIYNPQLNTLQRKLAELKKMVEDNTHLPQADVHYSSAQLFQAQGQYHKALEQLELAWSKKVQGKGFFKSSFAFNAVIVNLHLGDFAAARRWCKLLGQTEKNLPISRVAWHEAQVYLALWEQNTVEAETQACMAEEQAEGLQRPEFQQKAMAIRVRTLLLTNPDDPTTPRHPARYRLAQRLPGKPQVDMVYERRLVLVDYRLAAVRYAVGMQPVDDFWYTRPQTLPDTMPTLDRDDFQKREFHTRRALRRAMVHAEYLDGCWECSWRQAEIRGREARLDEIVRVVQ
jgi:hypothetical protein